MCGMWAYAESEDTFSGHAVKCLLSTLVPLSTLGKYRIDCLCGAGRPGKMLWDEEALEFPQFPPVFMQRGTSVSQLFLTLFFLSFLGTGWR